MKIVGLTGGIGSGKTTVSRLFAALDVPVYNSDMEAKKLMNSSTDIRKKMTDLFGEEAYVWGTLNRSLIADKVFNDSNLLKSLNQIVHPEVRKDFMAWCKVQEHPYVIQESALIFENRSQDFYDWIVLVTAPLHLKLERLMDRDQSTAKDIEARMKNQLEDAEKLPFSHFIIENIDLENTRRKVAEINMQILDIC